MQHWDEIVADRLRAACGNLRDSETTCVRVGDLLVALQRARTADEHENGPDAVGEAREEGYDEGFADGAANAADDAQAEIDTLRDKISEYEEWLQEAPKALA